MDHKRLCGVDEYGHGTFTTEYVRYLADRLLNGTLKNVVTRDKAADMRKPQLWAAWCLKFPETLRATRKRRLGEVASGGGDSGGPGGRASAEAGAGGSDCGGCSR